MKMRTALFASCALSTLAVTVLRSDGPCDVGAAAPRVLRAHDRVAAAVRHRTWDASGSVVSLATHITHDATAIRSESHEAYAWRCTGHAVDVSARSCNGVMYGLYRLADWLYTCSNTTNVCGCIAGHVDARVSAQSGAIEAFASPQFSFRYYSDQGQMLDMPDRGYFYTITPPPGSSGIPALVNESRVQSDADTLAELIPVFQLHGLNGFVWESSSIEDYINYDYLPKPVYAANDLHRNRTAAFSRVLSAFTQTFANEGLDVYTMLIDLTFPEQLAEQYNITSVYSPDLPVVLTAKFRELFERVPALTGVLVYVCDSWFPRAGYNFSIIWNGPYEMAALATAYYNAVQTASNGTKQLLFSMWIPVSPLDSWGIFRNNTPDNITLLVNDGQGDFLYDHAMNTIIEEGGGRDRRMLMASDAFRQYDGWGRVMSFPGQEWAERVQYAANTSVAGLAIYGEWSPGNSWPDSLSYPDQGELLNWTSAKGYKSWIGYWNEYRIFQLQDLGMFSPNEGNVYVLSHLAWNPYQDPLDLLTSWARQPPLSMNALAAPYIAAAYNVSADAWVNKYLPNVDEYAQEWSGVFTPKSEPNPESAGYGLLSLYANATLEQIIAANTRIAESTASAVSLVTTALQLNGSAAAQLALSGRRISNSEVVALRDIGAGLLLAVQKTQAYISTFAEFRISVWLNHTIGVTSDPGMRAAYCSELSSHIGTLSTAVAEFGQLYPAESAAWNIASPDPNLDVRPWFFRLNDRCMSDWLPLFQTTLQTLCVA